MSQENISEAQQRAIQFGEYFRNQRETSGETLEDRAKKLEMEPDMLADIEYGNNPLTQPHIIAGWARRLDYSAADTIDLMVASGHLPPVRDRLIDEDRPVLMGAMKELFNPDRPNPRPSKWRLIKVVLMDLVAKKLSR
jgi:hypothetical protein